MRAYPHVMPAQQTYVGGTPTLKAASQQSAPALELAFQSALQCQAQAASAFAIKDSENWSNLCNENSFSRNQITN